MSGENYFKANLRALNGINPDLAGRMEERERNGRALGVPDGWEVQALETRSGLRTLELVLGEKRIALASRYDPVREAKLYVEKQRESFGKHNYFSVMGFGMGYHVDELLSEIGNGSIVLVTETCPEILYQAMKLRDLTGIFSYPKLSLSCDEELPDFGMSIVKHFDMMTFRGLHILDWEYYRNTPLFESLDAYRLKLRAQMLQITGNVQTLMAMGQAYSVNSLINFKYLVSDSVFLNLMDKFEGIPGIVVSAGPSLDKNAHLLKSLGERALVCAVDTAVKPLLKMGITPHVVTTGDPQEANYRHLAGVVLPESFLICDPQAPPKTVDQWAGKRFFASFGTRFFSWFEERMEVGGVNVWGSVATIAYDIVLKMGCDPIIFVGQDLAFSGGRTYTKGTYFEDEDKSEVTVEAELAKNKRLIKRTDIYGEEVYTNRQMFAYCDFFLNRFAEDHGKTIVNATEGGILHGAHVTVMTLEEAIETFLKEDMGVVARIEEAHGKGNEHRLKYLAREMDRLISEFRRMAKASRKGYELSKKFPDLISDGEDVTDEARGSYNRMARLGKELDNYHEVKPFLEMLNQSGLYVYFSKLKEAELKGKEVDGDFLLKMNEAYSALFSTCLATTVQILPFFENARVDLLEIISSSEEKAIVLNM